MNKIFRKMTWWLNKKICMLIGHKLVTVIEARWRETYLASHKSGKKRRHGHWVAGNFQKCARCGKKLSNFKRYECVL